MQMRFKPRGLLFTAIIFSCEQEPSRLETHLRFLLPALCVPSLLWTCKILVFAKAVPGCGSVWNLHVSFVSYRKLVVFQSTLHSNQMTRWQANCRHEFPANFLCVFHLSHVRLHSWLAHPQESCPSWTLGCLDVRWYGRFPSYPPLSHPPAVQDLSEPHLRPKPWARGAHRPSSTQTAAVALASSRTIFLYRLLYLWI